MSDEIRTTCPYCGVGCGVVATRVAGVPRITGDPLHPANRGALCSKGSALDETLGLENRLLTPRVLGVDTSWEGALEYVARRLGKIIDAHGHESVALYVSGQLLTEDYYVANKLVKGYLGTANIDTNSRLCMASAVAAHQRAFGEDLVPVSYEDLELADLVVLVGSNLAWCHPVLYQRLLRAKERRPSLRLVVIDPRRTPTCDLADLHLPLRSGTDAVLFNGLLSWLALHSAEDREFVRRHTRGASRALLVAHNTAGDLPSVARRCGLEAAALRRFYEWFAATPKVVTLFSQGVNQSSSGTDQGNGIINAHLFTGRIGKPGSGPFSITGQPNAMGGREVGGFATALAAHMDLDNEMHRRDVQNFWGSPRIAARPGLKAVDMFEAAYRGEIKAIWILGTNPVVSMPNADRAREALRRCELVVVSDVVDGTDTTALAHALLPALAWGEKDGSVTNSERYISRQRSFLPAPGMARPDWWAICQVAQRLGFADAFAYTTAAQIFDEHARLTSIGARWQRALDLSGLVGLGAAGYETLAPVRWPVPAGRTCAAQSRVSFAHGDAARPPADERLLGNGRFAHADGRARLVPIKPMPARFARDEEYPLILNTGRVRDQWHSMTRSGRSPSLSAHRPEPYIEVHPADARAFGVRQGALARIVSRWGSMVGRVAVSAESARGAVFAPIHWSAMNSSSGRVGALVNPSVDPVSGEPAFKSTPVRLEPFTASWYGCIMTRTEPCLREVSWWACAQNGALRSYELAGRSVPLRWPVWGRTALQATGAEADFIDYEDASAGTYRAALLCDERLEGYVCVGRSPEKSARSWIASLFARSRLSPAERAALLAAKPSDPGADTGPIVCACFGVGRKRIEAVIEQGARELGAIGRLLKAGTHCGSCVPELRHLIAHAEPA